MAIGMGGDEVPGVLEPALHEKEAREHGAFPEARGHHGTVTTLTLVNWPVATCLAASNSMVAS